jgi:hypothetical protein
MPQIPHRLQPDTPYPDTLALINDNFDKTVQDINDFGARFSSSASGSVTVAANSWIALTIAMNDVKGNYTKDKMPLGPRADVAVDVNDEDHMLPYGSAVTTAMGMSIVTVRVAKTSRNTSVNEKATVFIVIHNLDAAPHDYFFVSDTFYMDSNIEGVFR